MYDELFIEMQYLTHLLKKYKSKIAIVLPNSVLKIDEIIQMTQDEAIMLKVSKVTL